MNARVIVLALFTADAGIGQIRVAQTEPDLDDLFARVSESAFVVRARALDSQVVARRVMLPGTPIGPRIREFNPQNLEHVTLFTVAVDEVVCRQEDFGMAVTAPAPAPTRLHIAVPSEEALSSQSRFDLYRRNRRESLWPNREYLLFLYKQPGQDMLVKTFSLETGVTYYRAMEGERGAVALPDAANPEKPYSFITPLVKAVTVFCEAVKEPGAGAKIRQLQGVRDFFEYPAWRKSVDEAIHEFQNPPRKLPQR